MAKFDIYCTQCLGMSHCGEVTADGESTIKLTDAEVNTLVKLVREKKSTDVTELELEKQYPDLYKKLDEAYHDMAYKAEEYHWLYEGSKNGVFEPDYDELMDYCEANCGFSFEYNEEDYIDEEGNLDEESLEDAKFDSFMNWLDDYVDGLNNDEFCSFAYDHLNADVTIEDLEYEVEIPDAIIAMAGKDTN